MPGYESKSDNWLWIEDGEGVGAGRDPTGVSLPNSVSAGLLKKGARPTPVEPLPGCWDIVLGSQ